MRSPAGVPQAVKGPRDVIGADLYTLMRRRCASYTSGHSAKQVVFVLGCCIPFVDIVYMTGRGEVMIGRMYASMCKRSLMLRPGGALGEGQAQSQWVFQTRVLGSADGRICAGARLRALSKHGSVLPPAASGPRGHMCTTL